MARPSRTRRKRSDYQAPAQSERSRARARQVKPAGQPKKGGKLVMAQVGDNANFEPFLQQPTAILYLENLFSTPVRYDNEIKPNPHLAESWQVAQDGKSVTIPLRTGVRFHDGSDMTAADVKASLERWMKVAQRGKQPLHAAQGEVDDLRVKPAQPLEDGVTGWSHPGLRVGHG